MTFPELFKHHREQNDKTQRELGKKLGCTNSYISYIESGTKKPDPGIVENFIKLLGLSLEDKTELCQAYQEFVPKESPINAPKSPLTNLHQVPLPYKEASEFIGRAEQLDQLRQWLQNSQIVLVRASAGMGKTTLVYHLAQTYLLDEKCPFKAIIWTTFQPDNLSATGIKRHRSEMDKKNDWLQLCQKISDCLRRPDMMEKTTPQEIARVLGRQRRLLIIDNFETIEDNSEVIDFIELLPRFLSIQLVLTSRHAFDIDKILNLTALPELEALELIMRVSKNKGKFLREAQKQSLLLGTEGRAIAIVWSLGRMAMGDNIDTVLRELHNPHGDLVQFCFDRSYSHIKEKPAEKLLAALCVFAHNSATIATLATVTQLTPKETEAGLAILDCLSFINNDSKISLLPLTKEYASVIALPQFETELNRNFVDYFAGLCYGVTKGDYWGGVKVNAKSIEAELPNMYIAFDLATSLQDWRGVQNIYTGLAHILSVSRIFYKRRIILAQKALQAAQELGDVEMQAWYYIDALGWAFMAIREPEEGLKQITKGQKLAEDNNLTQCSACADVVLSEYEFFYQHNEEACLKYIDSGWSKHPELFIQSRLHQSQMKCYRQKKEWETAKNICLKAIELAGEYPFDVAWLQRFLGESYLYLKEWDKAEEAFKRSIKLYDENSYHRHSLVTNIGLAKVYFHQDNEEEMSKYIQKAKSFCYQFELKQELEMIETFNQHPEKDFDLRYLDLF